MKELRISVFFLAVLASIAADAWLASADLVSPQSTLRGINDVISRAHRTSRRVAQVCEAVPGYTFFEGMGHDGDDISCLHNNDSSSWSVASQAAACSNVSRCRAFTTDAVGLSCLKADATLSQAQRLVSCHGIYLKQKPCDGVTPIPVASVVDLLNLPTSPQTYNMYGIVNYSDTVYADPYSSGLTWNPQAGDVRMFPIRVVFASAYTISRLSTVYVDEPHKPTGFELYDEPNDGTSAALIPSVSNLDPTPPLYPTTSAWTTSLTPPVTVSMMDIHIQKSTSWQIYIVKMYFYCPTGSFMPVTPTYASRPHTAPASSPEAPSPPPPLPELPSPSPPPPPQTLVGNNTTSSFKSWRVIVPVLLATAAAVAIIGAVVFCCFRRRQQRRLADKNFLAYTKPDAAFSVTIDVAQQREPTLTTGTARAEEMAGHLDLVMLAYRKLADYQYAEHNVLGEVKPPSQETQVTRVTQVVNKVTSDGVWPAHVIEPDMIDVHYGVTLDAGAMGVVDKGELQGQAVAVKTLAHVSDDGGAALQEEMALMARLDHVNVVRLHGSCVQPSKVGHPA